MVVVVVVVSMESTTESSRLFVTDEALEDLRDFFLVDELLEQLFRLPLRREGSGEATCSEDAKEYGAISRWENILTPRERFDVKISERNNAQD